MMLSAGYFRLRSALPGPVWTYPLSYIAFHTYAIQASLSLMLFYFILPSAVSGFRSHLLQDFESTICHELPYNSNLNSWIFGRKQFFWSAFNYMLVNLIPSCLLNGSLDLWTVFVYQGLLENEYIGTSFAVGQVRSISGYQALRSAYDISPNSNSKWGNLLVLFLMAVGYRILVFVLLRFRVRKNVSACRFFQCNQNTNDARWMDKVLSVLFGFSIYILLLGLILAVWLISRSPRHLSTPGPGLA